MEYFKNLYQKNNSVMIFIYSVVIAALITFFESEIKTISGDVFGSDWGKFFSLILIAILVVVVVKGCKAGMFDNKSINSGDYLVATAFTTSILLTVYYTFINNTMTNNLLITLCILFLLSVTTFFRVHIYLGRTKLRPNLLKLEDLDELDNIDVTSTMFDETATDNDLLERGFLVDQINEILINLIPEKKFVLGLEGKWGSGKSTILNIVKRSIKHYEEIIMIDTFEPWAYNDEKSMLKAMILAVISKIDLGISSVQIKKMIKEFMETVFSLNNLSVINELILRNIEIEEESIVSIINLYLSSNGKKLVFVIDNLDRTQKEHVLFVYKAVAALLGLENVIYILSYDKEVVTKMLQQMGVESKYLEKIIQKRFEVYVDGDRLNTVMLDYLKKFCTLHNFDLSALTNNDLQQVIIPIKDLREFKLFLNQLSISLKSEQSRLNVFDVLGITLIKTLCPTLYSEISQNPLYFLTEGLPMRTQLSRTMNSSFENDAKEYFKTLKEHIEWKKYYSLLKKMFLVIERIDSDYSEIYSSRGYNHEESERMKKISNARYFPVFYAPVVNRYMDMNQFFEKMMNLAKNNMIDEKFTRELYIYIESMDTSLQVNFLEKIRNFTDELDVNHFIPILEFFIGNTHIFSNAFVEFQLAPRNRAQLLIATCLTKMSDNQFKKFSNDNLKKPKLLFDLHNIRYWVNPETEGSSVVSQNVFTEVNDIIKSLSDQVLNTYTDIFDPQFYSKNNFIVLTFDHENDPVLTDYLDNVLNSENIGKFVNEFIRVSSSSKGYGYTADMKKIQELISLDKVTELLSTSKNDDDSSFVQEVYSNSFGKSVDSISNAVLLPNQKKRYGYY